MPVQQEINKESKIRTMKRMGLSESKARLFLVSNVEEAIEAVKTCSSPEIQKAYRAWLGFCSTTSETKNLFTHLSNYSNEYGRHCIIPDILVEIRDGAYTKWRDLSKKEIKRASNLETARETFDNAPEKKISETEIKLSPEKINAYCKYLSYCQTSDEIYAAIRDVPDNQKAQKTVIIKEINLHQEHWLLESLYKETQDIHLKKVVVNEWRKFSRKQLKKVSDFSSAENVFGDTLRGSREEILALKKWLKYCHTSKDIEEIENTYSETVRSHDSDLLEKIRLEKWLPLSRREIQKASTQEELESALYYAPLVLRDAPATLRKAASLI